MPCFKCTDRVPGCHATCAIYIAERERLDRENEARARAQKISNTIYEMNMDSIKRARSGNA